MKIGNKNGRSMPDWRNAALGAAVGFLMMIALASLSSWAVCSGVVDHEWMNELSALILVLCSVTGGMISRGGGEKWYDPLFSGVFIWLLLVLIAAVLFDGRMSGILPVSLVMFGGSASSLILNMGKRRRRNRRKRGYR